MMTVRDLHFRYSDTPILRALSFAIPQGAVVGILGPNGSGKSTLCRLLAGLIAPTAGTILLDGAALASLPRKSLARQIAFVPQETHIAFPIRARDVVRLGRIPHQSGWGIAAPEDAAAVAAALCAMTGETLADRNILELSGGERQRILLARALAGTPRVLICDEPTTHLDLRHQLECMECLVRLTHERGTTVITSLHDVNLAARFCSHLLLLRAGRAHGFGPPRAVLTAESLSTVYDTPMVVLSHAAHEIPLYVPRTP
ncbi:MAG: ABC transporter ATP-binding protein [Deltaproteobacteria bacterium]|nr:ABC transporter ATP-binding protein [Deltaproteobacteria bacterium]